MDTWIHAFTKSTNTVTVESVNALYGEYSEATGTGMKFYTPKAPTPKKALHPDFTVESGTQENLIHAILHVRRILTCMKACVGLILRDMVWKFIVVLYITMKLL